MPKKFSPRSLTDLAAEAVNSFVMDCVSKVKNTESKKEKIEIFNRHLTTTLPSHVIDILQEKILLNNEGWVDVRNTTSLYLHGRMKKFSAIPIRLRNSHLLTEKYIMEILPGLTHLKILNIGSVATDEILELVTEHLSELEIINIVSRLTRVENGHNLYQCHVSSRGLICLTRCRKLRFVIMDDQHRVEGRNFVGEKITADAIAYVISHLPDLQFISYANVLGAIDSFQGPFKLRSVIVKNASESDLVKFFLKVPCLRELKIDVEESINFVEPIGKIKLTHLEVNNSSWNCVSKYLIAKGNHITYLSLSDNIHISSADVNSIGLTCPNLSDLSLLGLTKDSQPYSTSDVQIFPRIERLFLGGREFDSNVIVMCCKNAHYIEKIELSNGSEMALDEVLKELISTNRLKWLREINFFEGCLCSPETLEAFFIHCGNLEKVIVKSSLNLPKEKFIQLKEKLLMNFFNFKMSIF